MRLITGPAPECVAAARPMEISRFYARAKWIGRGVGAALIHPKRTVISFAGDGDFLMGVTALWTASHLNLPMMIVVANNTSFFNDELHQERVAKARARPVENRWIGQRLTGPEIDIVAIAKAQGLEGEGPVLTAKDFAAALLGGAAALPAHAAALAMRQHDRTDHRDEEDDARRLEQEDVARVEQFADLLDIALVADHGRGAQFPWYPWHARVAIVAPVHERLLVVPGATGHN